MYQDVPYELATEEFWAAITGYFACVMIFALVMVAFMIWVWWRILTRAGYSGWLSLLNLIGGLGSLILLLVLAFGDWPALKKAPVAYTPPAGGYPPPSGGYSGYSAPAAPPQPAYIPPAPEPAPPVPVAAPPAPEPIAGAPEPEVVTEEAPPAPEEPTA